MREVYFALNDSNRSAAVIVENLKNIPTKITISIDNRIVVKNKEIYAGFYVMPIKTKRGNNPHIIKVQFSSDLLYKISDRKQSHIRSFIAKL